MRKESTERTNPLDARLIMYAHILGDLQKCSDNFSEDDKVFLRKIFHDVEEIRYSDISNELCQLKAKVVSYTGVESGIINLNKGATI
jgi:hypothetical protein